MNHKWASLMISLLGIPIFAAAVSYGENIDPNDDGSQYAYAENIGWLNFEPNIAGQNVGAEVNDGGLTGFIWAENIGWINLGPNDTDPNTGIENDGTGLLTGFAWAENVGWIGFNPKVPGDPNHYGVTINHQGNFAGWAWGENIGWIHFRPAGSVDYKIQTLWATNCFVDLDDLARFCSLWLKTGPQLKADLDDSNDVDLVDYSTLAELWFELCPVGWPLNE